MGSTRPPPGLQSISLSSIASMFVPTKNDRDNRMASQPSTGKTTATSGGHAIDCHLVSDKCNKQKRGTELAAVANNCALSQDYNSAIAFYSEAIELNPGDFRFYCNRSLCYENIKQFDKSLDDANTAIQLNPHRPKPYFRKGRSLFGLKKYEEAEEAFKQVLKIDPDCEATNSELIQVRYIALREVGFDIDAALLAAKRCESISEAVDFVVNVELLSLKSNDGFDCSSSENRSLTSSIDSATSSCLPTNVSPVRRFMKTDHQQNKDCFVDFKNDSPIISSVSLCRRKPFQMRQQTQLLQQQGHQQQQLKPFMAPTNLFGYRGLWVGNVYPKTNVATLRALFSKYGKVQNAKILKDKFCAFISFDDPIAPRKAIADLNEKCVRGVSNEWRPLKFRFIPTAEQPELNFARPVQPRNNNNECYFWRTTGCNAGDKCKLRHISICKGIDFQPWMQQ